MAHITFLYIFPSLIFVYDSLFNEEIVFVVIERNSIKEQVLSPFFIEEGEKFSIECMGYKKSYFTAHSETMKIYLEKNAIEMKGSLVYSEALKNEIKKGSVNTNMSDALENLFPYIQIRHFNRSNTITLAGMSQEHILFSLDEVPIINQMSRIVDIDLISPAMIESANVSRNSNSALFGENLFGGIINFKTKKKNFSSIASLSMNSGEISANVDFEGLKGGFFLNSYSDMIMPEGAILSNSDKSVFGYNIGFDSNNIKLSLINSMCEAGDPGIEGYRYKTSRIKNSLVILTGTIKFNDKMKFVNSITKSSYFYFNDELSTPARDSSFFNSILSGISYYNELGNLTISNQINSAEGTKIKKAFEFFPSAGLSTKADRFAFDVFAAVAESENTNFVYSINSSSYFHLKEMRLDYGFKTSVRRPTFNELYWIEDAFAKGNENLNNEVVNGVFINLKRKTSNLIMTTDCGFNYYTSIIKWVSAEGKYTPMNIENVSNPYLIFSAEYENGFVKASNIFSLSPNIADNFKMVPYSPVFADNFSVTLLYRKIFFELNVNYTSDSYLSSANTKKINQKVYFQNAGIGINWSILRLVLSVENPLDMSFESVNGYYIEGRNIKLTLKAEL